MQLSALSRSRPFWRMLSALLLLMAGIQIGRGFALYFHLLSPDPGVGHCDATWRWTEIQYVLRGKNPFDVAFAHTPEYQPFVPPSQAGVTRDAALEPDLGISMSIYPPWSYASALPLFFTSSSAYIPLYAAVMAACLAFITFWAFRQGRVSGGPIPLALAASVLGFSSWGAAVYTGNYVILIVAAVVASYVAMETKHSVLAGIFMGWALLKPTTAGPFLIVFLLRREFLALLVAAVYVIFASLVTWRLTHTDPFEMLHQMAAASGWVAGHSYGPVQYLLDAGVPAHIASPLVAVTALLTGTGLLIVARRGHPLALFGIAGVVARLWSYHWPYDDNIMLFALLAFVLAAVRTGKILPMLGFLALGATLWMPLGFTNFLVFQITQQCIWIAAAIILAIHADRWLPDARAIDASAEMPDARETSAVVSL